MYISEFVCGIFFTIFAEIAVVVGYAIYNYVKRNRRRRGVRRSYGGRILF